MSVHVSYRIPRLLMLIMLCVVAASFLPNAATPAAGKLPGNTARQRSAFTDKLQISTSSNRGRAKPLKGSTVAGSIYVFVNSDVSATRVRFFLDHPEALLEDPRITGTPLAIDQEAPFDLAGTDTGVGKKARPFNTKPLRKGKHSIHAALDLRDGSTEIVRADFTVAATPALAFTPDALTFDLLTGSGDTKAVTLDTPDGQVVTYTISENAPWLTVNPQNGSTPGTPSISVSSVGLAAGTYTTTVTAATAGYASATLPVTLNVSAETSCTPVRCDQIKVALPYTLDWTLNHGQILDTNGVGTGFTYIDRPSNGTGYLPGNLQVDPATPGTLRVATTAGIAHTTINSLDNALAVGIDAPNQISLLKTTLRDLPAPGAGANTFAQAGLWFGNNQDNFVKLVIIAASDGLRIQHQIEVNGVMSGSQSTAVLNLTNAAVSLMLHANPADRSITASYQINGAAAVVMGQFIAPSEFFSFDAAGIDPRIGTRSFGGVHATHRKAPASLVYTFDNFSVTNASPPPPLSPDGPSFVRASVPITNPTALVWGQDNRLYVTEMMGPIHALRFDAANQVTGHEVITVLGTRLTLGITIDPRSTASNMVLWVTHSSPSASNGVLNSSIISRLSGPDFTTRQDVITGLPRAIANHAVNAVHFGPDGKLYIALGGNTGGGAANTTSSEFGQRAEQPLSAALLVADVYAAGFDGTCAMPENTFGPAPCSVKPFATGLRNTYDFVFHSTGAIYATDNGLGVTGSYPASPWDPCTGFASTALWNEGGHNPGDQPDLLLRLEPGKYYGHPNPYRGECVYKDGSFQNVAPLTNYVAPIHNLGMNVSANGIIEYTNAAFGGALKGELLIVNYSRGDDITRIRLAGDGHSVIAAKSLAGGFNNPLALAQGPDGTLYVAEHGGNRVTVLQPASQALLSGMWTTKEPMPTAIMDAGGTALGDKLYSVGGKTSTGYLSTMRIYDPATNAWATGPNLPGPAIENPAVVALNGKLYVFGGSTAPFAGAVTNASVFDPVTRTWSALPPLPSARAGATAQAINGKIYLVGGMSGAGASLSNVDAYDPVGKRWTPVAPMATRRDNPGSAALNGKLYVFGGRTRNADGTTSRGTLTTVEMYDPATNIWSARTPMPTGRRTMVVGTLNGRAQLIGGEATSTGDAFTQNEEYDPTNDTWRTLAAIPTPRHGAVSGTIRGVVYVAGGGIKAGSSYTNIVEAFTLSVP